jgi:hypothetical protein
MPKPFKVFITSYSLSVPVGGAERFEYQSLHATAGAAARRLASIIHGKSALSKKIKACIGCGRSGRYKIVGADGEHRALIPHRRHYGMTTYP